VKNVLISFFILIFSTLSLASSVDGLMYKDIALKNSSRFIHIAEKLSAKLNKNFIKLNFKPLSQSVLPEIYFAHQSYSNYNSQFMFRLGVVYPKELEGKIIEYKKGYLYHFHDQIPSAIYSSGMSKQKLKTMIELYKRAFRKIDKSQKYSVYKQINLMSSAHADTSICNTAGNITPVVDVSDYEDVNKHVSTNSMTSIAGDCFMSTVKQAWNATGGFVADAGNGIWNFIKSPVKSIGKAWDGAVNMVKTTTKFISNIKENIKSLGTTLAGLSSEMISKIMCSITGALGGEQLLKMLINPAVGVALLIPKVIKMFNKLKVAKTVLGTLDKVSRGYQNSSKMVNQFLNNFFKSTKAKFTNTLNLLAKYKMDDRLLEYGVCGLE
jgi:hypothetical protein